jgi:RecA-family ATPase
MKPSQIRSYEPPAGSVLVGENHIVHGEIFVIGGAPGVGKSRASVALTQAAATEEAWFGLEVHRQFRTMILQNENGKHRLKMEVSDIPSDLEEYVRSSSPPQYGFEL